MEIDAPAGITAGARRSLRLQASKVCPLLRRGGYTLPDRFLTTQMRLPPELLASYIHRLDDVASTPLSEPTSVVVA